MRPFPSPTERSLPECRAGRTRSPPAAQARPWRIQAMANKMLVDAARGDDADAVVSEAPAHEGSAAEPEGETENASAARAESPEQESPSDGEADKRSSESGTEDSAHGGGLEVVSDDRVESVGAE